MDQNLKEMTDKIFEIAKQEISRDIDLAEEQLEKLAADANANKDEILILNGATKALGRVLRIVDLIEFNTRPYRKID